jgi:hypothetical protein
MTLNQLNSLDDQELMICLYIVNIISPPDCPKTEFGPNALTWFKHEFLVRKIVNAFPKILPEGYAVYVSLLDKLGYKFELPPDKVTPIVDAATTASVAL